MITMFYPSVDHIQKSIKVISLYYLYKNPAGDSVIFKIKGDSGTTHVLYHSNTSDPSNNYKYIVIDDTVFNAKEIVENPDRIYTLMQQDLLKDSIEALP